MQIQLFAQKTDDSVLSFSRENIDLKIVGIDSSILRIFPIFDFQYYSEPNKNHFLNSRGAGLLFNSGMLEVYSSFYDTQINNLSGNVSDSTLYGLNYVRFKGNGEAFQPGIANRADFDDANAYLKYRSNVGTFFYGKYLFKDGPSKRNNLLFNSTSGSFPHFSYSFQNNILTYKFMYGFLKHFQNHQELSEKAIVYHKLEINLYSDFSFYGYEALMQTSHSIKVEYLNPLIFLRSADHYNFSPANALMGFGLQYKTPNSKTYFELLIDDMDVGELGTGWFRNKTAGLIGTEIGYSISDFSLQTVFESNWVTPFTFSHRNKELNLSHYGTPLGPELGPNSFKLGLYNSITHSEYPIEFSLNYEILAKGLSVETTNYGDDIEIGHPDIFNSSQHNSNIKFANYPKLLDGKKTYTNRYVVGFGYKWKEILFGAEISYYSRDFFVPHIQIEKGIYWNLGMKYRFEFFDNLRPEFW